MPVSGALPGGWARRPGAAPLGASHRTHIHNQFVIRIPNRDGLHAHLEQPSIGTEIYYPVLFDLQTCFGAFGYKPGAFPMAEAAARESPALPMYGELNEQQQATVAIGGVTERAFEMLVLLTLQ